MKKWTLVFFLFLTNYVAVYAVAGKKQVRVRLTDSLTAVYDEANIYLDLGATSDYVFPEDGQKIIDTSLAAPLVYSFTTDNVPCFSNSYGNFTQKTIVPIGFCVHGGSTYIFSSTLIDNFESTSLILLEDRLTGIFTDLRIRSYSINVQQQTHTDNRFYLHISLPAQFSTTPSGCDNNDGIIQVYHDSSVLWNSVILFDGQLNIINSLGNVTGNFMFSGLAEGAYKVVFAYDIYTAIIDMIVAGNQISVNINPSILQAAPYQTIIFTANTTNTNYYDWNMGDSSYITGVASPDYYYTDPGTYQVVVECSNAYGCIGYDTITIIISVAATINETMTNGIAVTVDNKLARVFCAIPFNENSEIEIFNVTGLTIMKDRIAESETLVNLQHQPAGMYFLKLKSGLQTFTRSFFLL